VYATLLRGHLHPAIQKFDARRLIRQLEQAAAEGDAEGEEWEWLRLSDETPRSASAIFFTCPRIDGSEEMARRFSKRFRGLGLSGYDESTGHVIPCLLPKLNCFITGQLPRERHYDITPEELPFLIRRIDSRKRDPFGILETNRSGQFVQCHATARRFCVEWANNDYVEGQTIFDQWRAQDRERLAKLDVPYDKDISPGKDPDLLLFADAVNIFKAFMQGQSRPVKYHWMNINSWLQK
jgi:hypothetical protein